ncbi:MAG: regulatory protein RecX [Clostridia bacterium]|nr:regulatory protein RecX [Clostridia bacterium]MBN2883297.1 regulatory protein RecX [Clostridia bacterium]
MKINRKSELNKGFLLCFEDGSEIKVSEELYFTKYLYEKEELSKEEIEQLIFQDKVIEAEIMCRRKLATGLKPKSRLLAFLDENGLGGDIGEAALLKLEKENYIDDLKYANKITIRKMITSPLSKYALEQWLLVNGLSMETARTVIEKSNIDDRETARKIVEQKFKAKKNPMKIAAFLASRGFDKDIIAEVTNMEELWNI